MALPAAKAQMPWLYALTHPAPSRIELTIRLTVICTLVTWATCYYRTPEPAIVAYIVYFINRSERTTSVMLCLAMTVVATVVIGIIFSLTQILLEHPYWRIASMIMISLLVLFFTSASKIKPLGGILTLVLAFSLDLMGSSPLTELLTRGLLYAWLFVAIPTGITVLYNIVFAPSPRRLVEHILARRLMAVAAVLRGESGNHLLINSLQTDDVELQNGLSRMAIEQSTAAEDMVALRWAVDSSVELLSAVVAYNSDVADRPQLQALAEQLEAMAAVLNSGAYPINIDVTTHDLSAESQGIQQAALAITSAIKQFAQPKDMPQPPVAKPKSSFMAEDAWTAPVHWQYAVKTTLAAMICYFIYTLLHWPGIHTSMLTCYIVSLATVADSVEKLMLRIIGCLLGAALGLMVMVFILPSISTLPAYLSLVFLGTLLASWLAAGNARVSYIGFQMAFAFFLCVIQGAGPSFDMTLARDRVIGILLGNLVVYIVATRLWPISLRPQLHSDLRRLLKSLRNIRRGGQQASLRLIAECQSELGRLRDGFWRLRYERFFPAAPAQQGKNYEPLLARIGVLLCEHAIHARPASASVVTVARRPQSRIIAITPLRENTHENPAQ